MTLVIAHRGASGYELENTLAAFRRASEMGADGAELDVHATADGAIVVHHDADIDGAAIKDLSLSEVQDFVLSNGERVPTLAEALGAIEGTAFVEVKALAPSNDAALFEAIDGRDRPGGNSAAHIHSFEHKIIARLASRRPDQCYGVLSVASQVHPESLWRDTGAVEIWQNEQFLDRDLIHLAHSEGCRVFAWTTDDAARMLELRDMDVDGICTNKPDVARRCLA